MIGRLTKQAVKKTLGRAFILREQPNEVEAMLNDRSLKCVSSDLSDYTILFAVQQMIPHILEDQDINDPDFLTITK